MKPIDESKRHWRVVRLPSKIRFSNAGPDDTFVTVAWVFRSQRTGKLTLWNKDGDSFFGWDGRDELKNELVQALESLHFPTLRIVSADQFGRGELELEEEPDQ